MNTQIKFILTGLVAFAAGGLLVFYLAGHPAKPGGDEGDKGAAAGPVQMRHGANGETILTLDAETQARMGLKTENPVSLQWQPEVKGYGTVIDPATLSAAVADLESARTAAEASGKEYDRLKILAAQDNVSARALETAKATATHDELAFQSALRKFALDWGQALAGGIDREKILSEVANGRAALVRIDLSPGETLSPPPASARMVALTDETKSVAGRLCSATVGVNPQTQSQTFIYRVEGQPLTLGSAVTGFLKISGEPVAGVLVPAGAVLRYEGKGWIYVQTGTNDFTRAEISLDQPAENGWFVSGHLTATNGVVVVGAQTVLSAELSGGNFNTGERD
jgi:hypothetical protein